LMGRNRNPRARRIILAILGVVVALGAAVFLDVWISSGNVIEGERQRIAQALERLRLERVHRPVLFEPAEDGNSFDLIKLAAEPARTTWTSATWSPFFTDNQGRLKSVPDEERDRVLETISPQFEILKRALRRSLTDPDRWSEAALRRGPSYLGENRLLGVLDGAIRHRAAQGRFPVVADYILISLGLSDRLKVKGDIWAQVNGGIGDRIAFDAIRRHLADPAMPLVELNRLASAIERLAAAPREDYVDAHFRFNLQGHHWLLRACDGDREVRKEIEDNRDSSGAGSVLTLRDAYTWRLFVARRFALDNADARRIASVADRPPVEWMQELRPLGEYGPSPETRRFWCLIYVAQHRLDMAMARVALAVSRFAEGRGRWPRNLDELAPEYLETIPVDPWTRQPLSIREMSGDAVISAPDLDKEIEAALSHSQIKASEWRAWTVKRRK